jgi:thymidylate synthase (FAD)
MELVNEYNLLAKKENIFGDNIAYVEAYDFSKANMSNENRMKAITQVASICYQNPKAFGSESLYNRLAAESHSLPSSSFEFVPVLLTQEEVTSLYFLRTLLVSDNNPLTKYGEWIEDRKYLLTNFRAIVFLFENLGIDLRDHFNTEAECAIIAKHFKVFKMKVDMPTFGQAVRHRVNWQVLSRRYVSGTRVPFDFYIAEQMQKVKTYFGYTESGSSSNELDTEDVIDICISHYKAALEAGVKPQVARGIIPQCAYTVAWCAMQPKQFDSFIKLRTDSHAQWEITQLACAMRDLSEISD